MEVLVELWAAVKSEAGITAIIGAIIGIVGTILGTVVIEVVKQKRENRKTEEEKLAVFVVQMVDLLGGMITSFKANEIPHFSGRAFAGLYSQFGPLVYEYLKEPTRELALRLEDLAVTAIYQDARLYDLQNSDIPPAITEGMKTWIVQAERVRADLTIAAARIRARKSPP